MATAKKLPSGNWRVNLYVGKDENGKRIYRSFTAETKREAEYLSAQYNLKRKEKPEMTVGEAIDSYISAKENVLSPTTIGGYRNIRKNQMQDLMNIPISKIDNLQIQICVNNEAKRLSPKSIRNMHGLLASALKMYMPEFTVNTTLPSKEHKIKDLPSAEEVIKAIKGTDVELPALLALWLGLRMSEVRGLRYKDISDGNITVQNVRIKFGGKVIEKSKAKTYNSTRKIKLPESITELIPEGRPDDYIVSIPPCTLYKHFVKIIKDKTGKDMTFHDLRHLNASVMLMLGIPDKYAMERGGWSTNSTLKSVYQHTFSEKREEADDKINNYFSEILNSVKDKEE